MARGWRRDPYHDWTPPPRWRGTLFAVRRSFFEQHPEHGNGLLVCPACAYPTLPSRGGHDYCSFCHWEDDGHDDPYARESNGGPNDRLTLDRARKNFEVTCCIWSFAERNDFYISNQARLFDPEMLTEKQALRRLYDHLMALTEAQAIKAQWELIDLQWKRVDAVYHAIDLRFGEKPPRRSRA